jgi:hypothetical protein
MTTPSSDPPPAATGAGQVPPGPTGVPTLPPQTPGTGGVPGPTMVVATYPDYPSAQRAVDYLSDNRFPVERTAIVGTDLRLVENVLGRLTTARAALAGAASGALFGAIAHATTGGRRDFSSRSSLQASQYAITVHADVAEQARQLLTRLNWQASGAQ